MKNFKRLVAATLAAAMALALSVSAFAEAEVQNAVDASYANGKAVYEGTITADNGTQMTVVIINKEKANTTLTGDDLLYINQDVASASLYANMGTKDDLLAVDEETGVTLHEGTYLIRVGYYANNVWTINEGEFSIGTKPAAPQTITVKWGDIDVSDVAETLDGSVLINAVVGGTRSFTDTQKKYKYTWGSDVVVDLETEKSYTMSKNGVNIKWGDIDVSGIAETLDGSVLINAVVGGTRTFTDTGKKNTYTWGEQTVIDITEIK